MVVISVNCHGWTPLKSGWCTLKWSEELESVESFLAMGAHVRTISLHCLVYISCMENAYSPTSLIVASIKLHGHICPFCGRCDTILDRGGGSNPPSLNFPFTNRIPQAFPQRTSANLRIVTSEQGFREHP